MELLEDEEEWKEEEERMKRKDEKRLVQVGALSRWR
jgi:hypothetical protein